MSMRAASAMRSRAASCVGVMLALALAPCAGAAAGMSFTHKDWSLDCDNTGICRASGYQSERDEVAVSVLITRAPGPDGSIAAKVQFGSYGDGAPKADGPVRMTIAGKPAGTVVDGTSITDAQAALLLKALVGTGDVVFASGKTRWTLSGEGAAAVLLKMDAAQGRAGTPGAIVMKGPRPESTVPAPAPAPVIQAVRVPPSSKDDLPLARRVLATIAKSDDCPEAANHGARDDANADLAELWRLGSGRVLVTALCWRAAYNEGNGYWIAHDKPPYDAKLVTALAGGFAPGLGELTSGMKGRGLGDCWQTSTWVWDGQGFVHAAESSTGQCRLIAPGGAWDLPTLVSEVRKPR
jgi:hypothetical protein